MATRQSYSGTPEQFRRQVNSSVDQLLGSIDAQLKYRQLTDENKQVVKDLLKEVETRFRFVRRYELTTSATPEAEQGSLLESDADTEAPWNERREE